MVTLLGRLGDRLLSFAVPSTTASAQGCYWGPDRCGPDYCNSSPIRRSTWCCNGSCGKYMQTGCCGH